MSIRWDKSSTHLPLESIERDWLFDQDSLTQRLIKLSNNHFSVEIIREAQQSLRTDEYEKLGIVFSQSVWVREVILKGGGIPWVYARSVSPQITIDDINDFTQLGTQSLGSLLFSQHFTRSPIEVTRYPKPYLPIFFQSNDLWARRSCFSNKRITVLVQEVFLPDFWQSVNKNTY